MRYQIRSYNDDTFRNLNFVKSEIWNKKDEERLLAFNLCSKIFSNIFDFKFVYFTNGATEAINYFASNYKIQIRKHDYRYLEIFKNVSHSEGELFYFSYPFAGNGKFISVPNNKNIILDCSYMFSSNLNNDKIIPENVSYIIFSLSKSHNLADQRIGWLFSKTPISCYHILQYENNYSINNNIKPTLEIINNSPLNLLYLKYKTYFSILYSKNGLVENDVNLFGVDSEGNRIPYYVLESK